MGNGGGGGACKPFLPLGVLAIGEDRLELDTRLVAVVGTVRRSFSDWKIKSVNR